MRRRWNLAEYRQRLQKHKMSHQQATTAASYALTAWILFLLAILATV